MRPHTILIACFAVLTVAGCGNQETVPDAGAESASGAEDASTSGEDAGGLGAFEPLGGNASGSGAPAELMDQLVVYFDFDSSDIRADFNSMLAAHGSTFPETPASSCASKVTPTSAGAANTTSVSASGAHKPSGASSCCRERRRIS
jgi:hypothetical protein